MKKIAINGQVVDIGGTGGVTMDQVNTAISEALDNYKPDACGETWNSSPTLVGTYMGKPLYSMLTIGTLHSFNNGKVPNYPISVPNFHPVKFETFIQQGAAIYMPFRKSDTDFWDAYPCGVSDSWSRAAGWYISVESSLEGAPWFGYVLFTTE